MKMFFNEEIVSGWCFGLTWRCTPSEAIGLWSVLLFYSTVVIVTGIHLVAQKQNGNGNGTIGSGSGGYSHHIRNNLRSTSTAADDDVLLLCSFLIYFFGLVVGCLFWALSLTLNDNDANGNAHPHHLVHPFQIWQVQLLGSSILLTCLILFIVVHIDLGKNWSPIPEKKARHELVTDGIYQYARHPMYAIFLWAAVGTFAATLNFVISWCVLGLVFITLRRIETEERIMVDLFGEEYIEYRKRVSALGFGKLKVKVTVKVTVKVKVKDCIVLYCIVLHCIALQGTMLIITIFFPFHIHYYSNRTISFSM